MKISELKTYALDNIEKSIHAMNEMKSDNCSVYDKNCETMMMIKHEKKEQSLYNYTCLKIDQMSSFISTGKCVDSLYIEKSGANKLLHNLEKV